MSFSKWSAALKKYPIGHKKDFESSAGKKEETRDDIYIVQEVPKILEKKEKKEETRDDIYVVQEVPKILEKKEKKKKEGDPVAVVESNEEEEVLAVVESNEEKIEDERILTAEGYTITPSLQKIEKKKKEKAPAAAKKERKKAEKAPAAKKERKKVEKAPVSSGKKRKSDYDDTDTDSSDDSDSRVPDDYDFVQKLRRGTRETPGRSREGFYTLQDSTTQQEFDEYRRVRYNLEILLNSENNDMDKPAFDLKKLYQLLYENTGDSNEKKLEGGCVACCREHEECKIAVILCKQCSVSGIFCCAGCVIDIKGKKICPYCRTTVDEEDFQYFKIPESSADETKKITIDERRKKGREEKNPLLLKVEQGIIF
jgi:hypothetical protein